jgi:hypothetical protein
MNKVQISGIQNHYLNINNKVHPSLYSCGAMFDRLAGPLRLPCSPGVTSLTFLGETAPGETWPWPPAELTVEAVDPVPLPPVAAATPAAPSIPRTFSTALLSPLVHGSRFTIPAPEVRLAESRRLDSVRRAWRLKSRREPGPQSCEQPGVAQPPSLMERSPSQVLMHAIWPPWPHPWHQVQRAEPLGRGAVNGSRPSSSKEGTGSVGTEDWEERCEMVSTSGSGLALPFDSACRCIRAATHSAGGSMLMQMEQGDCGVLQRWQRVLSRIGFSYGL